MSLSNDAHDHNHRRTEKSSPGADETSSASLRNDSPPHSQAATDTSARRSKPLGRLNVIALVVAGIAALCAIAVGGSYALWALNHAPEQAAGPPVPTLSATPGPMLGDPQMLSETLAHEIDPSRSWQQTLAEDGISDSSPQVACIGPQPADQPDASLTKLRALAASGEDRLAALHRADAYDTVADAEKAFEFHRAELGACTDTSLYIDQGITVSGLGNEAVGVQLVLQETTPEHHGVVLVRTGHVVNLLDVARTGAAVEMGDAVSALTGAINRQCGPAVGLCSAPETSITVGVLPAGGEQPGLLTAGDIPRVTVGQGYWRGNPPAKQVAIHDGTGCEAVDFATVGGSQTDRTQRTYLLRNDAAAPPAFGMDQVMLTLGSAGEATELADRVATNIADCGARTLTSEIAAQGERSTAGAGGTEVKAKWFVVNQLVDANRTQKYRVGIVSAGGTTVYLRANPSETFDFTDEAWTRVALRAGERATQIQ